MEDLFEREQRTLNYAFSYLEELKNGAALEIEQYELLAREYERLLKQLRRFTKISDKTVVNLNMDKLDLLDKVHYDLLTGIYSRQFMEEKLSQLTIDLYRDGGCLSVLMVDIDFFKRFNDTYGHQAGDDCLRTVAKTLHSSLKKTDDFVARYGGEEFIVVLPNIGKDGACKIADMLLKNIRNCNIPHEKNEDRDYLTVSIGVTTGFVRYEQIIHDFIKRADEALYHSKNAGRNQYTFMELEEGHFQLSI